MYSFEMVERLGMEFGASEDQAALDQLVMGERYDENIARRLMFNYNVGWHTATASAWDVATDELGGIFMLELTFVFGFATAIHQS